MEFMADTVARILSRVQQVLLALKSKDSVDFDIMYSYDLASKDKGSPSHEGCTS
jgi:hypothetical protein